MRTILITKNEKQPFVLLDVNEFSILKRVMDITCDGIVCEYCPMHVSSKCALADLKLALLKLALIQYERRFKEVFDD